MVSAAGWMLLAWIGAAPEGPQVVAVFGLRDAASILKEEERAQLTRYLAAQIATGGRLLVVPEAELLKALRQEKAESYRECYDEACQIEIGRELAANKSLLTELVKLGSGCALVATLYDLERSTTEQATTERGACSVEAVAQLIERAAARLRGETPAPSTTTATPVPNAPPPAVDPGPPRPGVALSASHLSFLTNERTHPFTVEVQAPDGRVHRCAQVVTLAEACRLESLAIGEARLRVSAPALSPYDDTFDVEPRNHTKTFRLEERASDGSVIAWSLGGTAAAAGIAMLSVGIGVDNAGLVYAGIPSALVGLGVVALGFFFDGKVWVDESVLEIR